jgi:hypothetical protein
MLGCDAAHCGGGIRGTSGRLVQGEPAVSLAYLDPGSGSLIASVLVGGVAAAGVAAKQARARLGGLGRKKKQAVEPTVTEARATEDASAEDAPADLEARSEPDAPVDEPTAVSSDT